jgi:ABC-type ATPase with predicted acetyltransferase domain
MLTPFTLEYPLPPVFHTADTLELAAAYGLGREQPPYTVARDFSFPYQPGELVLLSGPSGSGKSSILRELARQLRARNLDDTPLPDGPILSAWPGTLAEKLDWASAVGLAEPRLLLRQPCELSEGQKDRFRLATALAQLAKPDPEPLPGLARLFWVDELAARLDRVTAKVLVYNLQKLLRRQGIGLLAATTHEDLLDDLNPDWHLDCQGDGDIRVTRRAVKKKRLVSPGS